MRFLLTGAFAGACVPKNNYYDASMSHHTAGFGNAAAPRSSVGIHWSTSLLTDEPLDLPVGDLATARAKAGIGAEFVTPRHGQTLNLDKGQ